ncbi:MAG: phage tail assembly protein [Rhizobiaceae bacterium]
MSVTVPLKNPIKIGKEGKEVSELTFREADVGDLIAGEVAAKMGGQIAQVAATLASMAGITYPEMRQVKAKDFAAISAATSALLGNE